MLFAVIVEISGAGFFLYGIPFAIIVGWLSGRILGVRRGWFRAFVSGFIGWLIGVVDRGVGPRPRRPDHRRSAGGLLPRRVLRDARVDVRQPHLRRHPAPEGAEEVPAVEAIPPSDRDAEAQARSAGAVTPDHRLRPSAWPHRAAQHVRGEAGHAGLRPPAPSDARGLRRHVREVRPDRIDSHRPASRGADDRAGRAAVLGPSGPGRRRASDDRERAARHHRGGVRVVRFRAAGGRLDRADPSSRSQQRRASRRQGPATRHRGDRATRCCRAALDRRPDRAAGRRRPPDRRQTTGRRADRLARPGAQLHARKP